MEGGSVIFVKNAVKHVLVGLIVFILSPSTVFAEYVIGNDDGVITADEIRETYQSNKEWLNVKIPKINDLDKQTRLKRTIEGWLNHLTPYVSLVNTSTIDEVKQHIFFPDETTCLSRVNDFYLNSFKITGQCSRKEWFLKEKGASLYYITTNSRTALFHVRESKVSLALVIEVQAGANYNFEPRFYHRVVNGENLLLLHLHGVIDGNGAIDHETLLVVNSDQTLSVVNTREMRNQLQSHLKDKHVIHRAHSFLSEESFTYWASTRSKIESPYIAAKYTLAMPDESRKYYLKLDPSTLQTDSKKLNALGLKKYKKGLYNKAVDLFKKAIQQTPTQYGHFNLDAHLNLGLALLRAGNINESIQVSELVYNHPEAGRRYKGNAAFNIGLAYEKQGDIRSAEKYFMHAYQLDKTPARKSALNRVTATPLSPELDEIEALLESEQDNNVEVFVMGKNDSLSNLKSIPEIPAGSYIKVVAKFKQSCPKGTYILYVKPDTGGYKNALISKGYLSGLNSTHGVYALFYLSKMMQGKVKIFAFIPGHGVGMTSAKIINPKHN